jgi:Fe-S cluster assembly protein SufD
MQTTELEILNEGTVRKLSSMKKEPEWLLERRINALKQFEKLEMPKTSSGLDVELSGLKPEEFLTSNVGSEGDVIIEDLSVAAIKYEKILKPLLSKRTDFQNKLEAVHAALWNNGVFVYVPDGKGLKKIKLEFGQKQTEVVYVVVLAGEGVEVEVLSSVSGKGNGKESYRVEFVDVIAKENSNVKFFSVQNLGENVGCMVSKRASVNGQAKVDWIDVILGKNEIKQETVSMLDGEGASSNMLGAFFGEGKQKIDVLAKMIHNARNTSSFIKVKGAAKDRAKAFVRSFTKIMGAASGSEGHQKANILLLSGDASASPTPELEIDNYDVKATHEASVGQLDREKMFYMTSKGIDEDTAVKLVVEGFFEPLLREIKDESILIDLRKAISRKMENVGERDV